MRSGYLMVLSHNEAVGGGSSEGGLSSVRDLIYDLKIDPGLGCRTW